MFDKMEEKSGESDEQKIQKALDILKPIAEKKGCSVSDLVAESESSESEPSEEVAGDDDKVNMIAARMKSKGIEG